MMIGNKKLLVGLLVIFLAVTALCAVFFLRVRNSVVVKPDADIACDNVIYYTQTDEAWKDDYLGDSKYQMAGSGCLTTCIASVLEMQEIAAKNPGEMNRTLSDALVYDAQGNMQWDALEKCFDLSVVRQNKTDAAEIENLLREKIYPIVRVRVGGLGNFHYVVIVGSEGGDFLCMDPLNGEKAAVRLSKFGNRVYALRYVSD